MGAAKIGPSREEASKESRAGAKGRGKHGRSAIAVGGRSRQENGRSQKLGSKCARRSTAAAAKLVERGKGREENVIEVKVNGGAEVVELVDALVLGASEVRSYEFKSRLQQERSGNHREGPCSRGQVEEKRKEKSGEATASAVD